jgi:hypothetical protein
MTDSTVAPIVDTYNWDTAFALNFPHANTAIVANWPNVSANAKNVSKAASDSPAFAVNGVLAPWQLVPGGDGKNVRMECTFSSGTYTYSGGSLNLAQGDGGQAVSAIIEVGMQWVPEPGQMFFVIDDTTAVAVQKDLNNGVIDAALQAAFTKQSKPLGTGANVTAKQASKEWLIEDGKNNYYIFSAVDKLGTLYLQVYQFEDDWKNILKLLSQATSASEPAVTIVAIERVSGLGAIARAALEEILSEWFTENLAEFNHVFAGISLAPTLAASAQYAWISPTGTGYAVVDEGTAASSIFGVLSTALHNDIPANHQVSPNAIPDGADAGFVIAGPDFLRQMMLAGARQIFDGAPESAFLITPDGLSITNTQTVVWGKFMMDNKKQGSISNNYAALLDRGGAPNGDLLQALANLGVSPPSNATVSVTNQGQQWLLSNGNTGDDEYILNLDGDSIDVFTATVINIDKANFKLSLVNSYVQIEFIDLYYPYSSDFDVHVNYTEQVTLSLQDQSVTVNGTTSTKKIFWFDQIERNLVVNVTKTQSAITREIVEGAITGALALVAVAGPIIEGLSAGAEVGEVSADAGEAVVDGADFAAAADANPEAAAADDAAAGEGAAAQGNGRLTNIKNAFSTPKWKFVGALAGLSGAIAGFDQAITAIIEAAAKKQWENVPGFDLFANQLIAPYSFPNISGFDLVSAGLNQSLVIGLKVKS